MGRGVGCGSEVRVACGIDRQCYQVSRYYCFQKPTVLKKESCK